MGKRTALYEQHRSAGAQLVDFAGWEMPLHYGSQIEEHRWVRRAAGMFDVSHMAVVDLTGPETKDFLRKLLANDVAKLTQPGKALYSCMLNEQGGVVDDLIVYFIGENDYRLVVNAGCRDKDLAWMRKQSSGFSVEITERTDLSIVAVQGPAAIDLLVSMLQAPLDEKLRALKPFNFFIEQGVQIARTGYTGEDGVEMIVPNELVAGLWEDLLNEEVKPCGLGARDTLRLEAGLNLYGHDMDETTSPLVSNLAWTVSFKDPARQFIGRDALEQEKEKGIEKKLVGLVMTEPGVLRDHQAVFIEGVGEGEITSGSFSPILNHAIAFARVPAATGSEAEVERRGKRVNVQITSVPFVKKGASK